MNEWLFSYGTLQKEEVQIKLFGRLLHGEKDSLPGYRLAAVEVKDEKFLAGKEEKVQRTALPSENKAARIEGMIFELSPREILQADSYEPEEYKRTEVTLSSGKKAWIYLANS
ncbi:MAG: gamma-glutamylcyclotransferase family protein [Chitinophagaceae bacterium]